MPNYIASPFALNATRVTDGFSEDGYDYNQAPYSSVNVTVSGLSTSQVSNLGQSNPVYNIVTGLPSQMKSASDGNELAQRIWSAIATAAGSLSNLDFQSQSELITAWQSYVNTLDVAKFTGRITLAAGDRISFPITATYAPSTNVSGTFTTYTVTVYILCTLS